MLNQPGIVHLAKQEKNAKQWLSPELGDSYEDGFFLGYNKCQQTIPTECIAFSEWLLKRALTPIRMYSGGELCKLRLSGTDHDRSLDELYNLYLQSIKTK